MSNERQARNLEHVKEGLLGISAVSNQVAHYFVFKKFTCIVIQKNRKKKRQREKKKAKNEPIEQLCWAANAHV